MKTINFKKCCIFALSFVIMIFTCCFSNMYTIETEAAGSTSRTYRKYVRATHTTTTYTLTQSESIYTRSSLGIVNGDNRTLSTNEKYVSGCVQFLYWNGADWVNSGNGFIVGENKIATAAHVVAHRNNNYIYTGDGTSGYSNDSAYRIKICNPNGSDYGMFEIESVHVPEAYFSGVQYDNDYAIVTLSNTSSVNWSNFGCFDLGTVLDSFENSNKQLKSISYTHKNNVFGLYVGTGNVYGIDNYSINYTCDTIGGQSGSPIVVSTTYNDINYDTVIAIVSTARSDDTYNTGVRITSPILQFYNSNSNI